MKKLDIAERASKAAQLKNLDAFNELVWDPLQRRKASYERTTRDREASVEDLRFAQGALQIIGDIEQMICAPAKAIERQKTRKEKRYAARNYR